MDDRGVSIAVTHVLTIGITTILIGGLIVAAGGLLDSEQERAADREIGAVGEGIASEMVSLAVTAEEQDLDEASITTNHPRLVTGQSYTVELTDEPSKVDGACGIDNRLGSGEYDACILLEAESVSMEVPLVLPGSVGIDEGATASGGDIVIEYDGSDLTIGGA